MKSESWKELPGFNGCYEVSTLGRVRSVMFLWRGTIRKRKFPKIKKQTPDKAGYLMVKLSNLGNKCGKMVHRIVLLTFVGPCPVNMECGHRDGNKTNNRVSNLRWVTKAQNMRDRDLHGTTVKGKKCWFAKYPELISCEKNPRSILSKVQVVDIINRHKKGKTIAGIAREFKVSEGCVRNIVKGRSWKRIKK